MVQNIKKTLDLGADHQVCESCGHSGEIGFIIKEGDDIASVSIFASSNAQFQTELAKYVDLASSIYPKVEHWIVDKDINNEAFDQNQEIKVQFQFSVSAEKLIFELKSRILSR